jgi:predicted nucleic acid-binding protein
VVIYWDASAILSVLVEDGHSQKAQKYINKRGVHFLSTLAAAETYAVLSRMKFDGILTTILYKSALEVFENSPLRKIYIQPEWKIIQKLSSLYVLKGADLWHLATVETIKMDLPETKIITFDKKLSSASKKEKVVV